MSNFLRTAALIAAIPAIVALLPTPPAQAGADGKALATKSDCFACHSSLASEPKKMGPNYADVAAKYAGNKKAPDMLAGIIRKGGSGHWGSMTMPPHPAMSDADAKAIATWVMSLKGGKGAKAAKPTKPAKK